MTVLFYRYGSICEPAMIQSLRNLNIEVMEETSEMQNKNLTPGQCIEHLSQIFNHKKPIFVFSINFFPAIAEICHIYKILYLCWTVDAPVLELFSTSIKHPTNRIFMFDRAQYEYYRPFNPDCIFHLPLASDVTHYENVVSSITATDRERYSTDISFVGSLYSEKNPLSAISHSLSEYTSGYMNGIVEASFMISGYNLMEETLTEDIIHSIQAADSSFFTLTDMIADPSRYVVAHQYLGMHTAETERIRTLNELAKHFDVTLYTKSDTAPLQNVKIRGGIQTLTEMPKAFHLSKINLNMTIPPIQTGLPLRIYDVLGCGGFLITNYRSELTELFEIGVDLETYSCLDELIDKCTYYLTHEDERKQIAFNGFMKVRKQHNYQKRIIEMLRIVTT